MRSYLEMVQMTFFFLGQFIEPTPRIRRQCTVCLRKSGAKVSRQFCELSLSQTSTRFEARCRAHLDAIATPIELPPVTGLELHAQVKSMRGELSPGLDGFSLCESSKFCRSMLWTTQTRCLDAFLPNSDSYHCQRRVKMHSFYGGQAPLKYCTTTFFCSPLADLFGVALARDPKLAGIICASVGFL